MMNQHGEQQGGKVYRDTNLQLLFGVTLLAVMGVAVIAPAFPRIVRELGITHSQVGLLVTVFTLPGVVLTPLLGVLADRWGRKTILVPALLIFGLAGVACSFTRDFTWLLVFRFFQGTGAAPLMSLNVTVIGDLYRGHRRTEALGYNASVLSLGTASYPTVGGALAAIGWYYPFALSAVAIPLAFLLWKYLENPRAATVEKLGTYFRNVLRGFTDPRVAGLFAGLLNLDNETEYELEKNETYTEIWERHMGDSLWVWGERRSLGDGFWAFEIAEFEQLQTMAQAAADSIARADSIKAYTDSVARADSIALADSIATADSIAAAMGADTTAAAGDTTAAPAQPAQTGGAAAGQANQPGAANPSPAPGQTAPAAMPVQPADSTQAPPDTGDPADPPPDEPPPDEPPPN